MAYTTGRYVQSNRTSTECSDGEIVGLIAVGVSAFLLISAVISSILICVGTIASFVALIFGLSIGIWTALGIMLVVSGLSAAVILGGIVVFTGNYSGIYNCIGIGLSSGKNGGWIFLLLWLLVLLVICATMSWISGRWWPAIVTTIISIIITWIIVNCIKAKL